MRETAESFLASRSGWIDVGIAPREEVQYVSGAGGDGYDIVVRLDGAYFNKEDAVVVAALFQKRLGDLGFLNPPVGFVLDETA